jgi:hypothetical protein
VKIPELIELGWKRYKAKVASGLVEPENEKMMQLQLSQIYQTLSSVYESEQLESIKVMLEVPVTIRGEVHRIIDIVISHSINGTINYYPIELKCFRLYTRRGDGKKRGAQNIGMYDYWEDIENIEGYVKLANYREAYQLTLTDDPYYVTTVHKGRQVAIYSTSQTRSNITGELVQTIANRGGYITLNGTYSMNEWQNIEGFWFVQQIVKNN